MGLFNRKEMTELQQMVQIRVGAEPIPGWTIVSCLGEGAFGSVWCIERSTGEAKLAEALKVIRIREDEHFKTMLKRELDSMVILRDHPNIVRCDDFVYSKVKTDQWLDNALMIRMELLTPLDKHFKTNPPDENEVIRMGKDVLKALEQLHKHDMIHRDIKPANIFRNNFGVYKLGDYGLARTLNDDTNLSVCGTPAFMAPEILLRTQYDQTVDTYALALTMYQYLNGGEITDIPSPLERMQGIIHDPENSPSWLSKILLKALAIDPEERFATPMDFLNALNERERSDATMQPIRETVKQNEQSEQVTNLQRTQRSVDNHRARLERSIQESFVSSGTFLDQHLNREG